MTQTISADLCVIGAGSGGLSVAAGAAQLGRKVVLIEKGKMGGDCLNYGCVPSKALIAAAARAHTVRSSARFGVRCAEPEVDFSTVIDHVHSVIATIAPHDSQERFESLGVTVIRAAGAFTGPRQIKAGEALIEAKHFVIATGSSPAIPPIDGLDGVPYFTNETIFENRAQPEHLIIIGGGPIGAELAQAFRRLGAKTTIIEAAKLLNNEDPDAVSILRAALLSDGVEIKENATVNAIRSVETGVAVDVNGETVSGSHLLVATGRRANIADLDLDKAGVDTSERKIVLNDKLQTSNKRIYVIGDAAGGAQFTHVAGDHASTVLKNILFKLPSGRRDTLSPRVTYTDPEIATIGLSEMAARNKNGDAKIVRAPFSENDRARAERNTDGFVKLVTDAKGGILGATIVGKNAGDLIHAYAFAVANNQKIKSFTNMIAPYPTRGEAAKRAASAWYTPQLFSDRTRTLIRLLSAFD